MGGQHRQKHTNTYWDIQNAVLSVAFSPDGNTIATGSWDDTIRLWDVSTGKNIRTTLTGHTNRSIAWHSHPMEIQSQLGVMMIPSIYGMLALAKNIRTLTGHTDPGVNSVAFSPDGNTIASGSA